MRLRKLVLLKQLTVLTLSGEKDLLEWNFKDYNFHNSYNIVYGLYKLYRLHIAINTMYNYV